MLFRPRRVGGSLSQGTKFGGGIRKTGIGGSISPGGQTSVGNNSASGDMSSCGQVAGVPVFNQNKKTGGGASTGLPQRKKWGFYDALVGQRGQVNKEVIKYPGGRAAGRDKMKFRFVESGKNDKGVKVEFDSRRKKKNRYKITIGDDFKDKYAHDLKRADREIARAINKELVRDVRERGIAKKIGGLKSVSVSSQRRITKEVRKNRDFRKKIQGSFSGVLGNKKSSRRDLEIDVDYRKVE